MNCYILTGGRSTRMGRSKTELFVDRVAAAAIPVFDRVVAVQRSDGPALTIPTIHESDHVGHGAVFGVLRALADTDDRCFILAVDYPRITSDVLGRLRSRMEQSQAPVVMPVWRGIRQTLCALYSPELLPVLERRVGEGTLDLVSLIEAVRGDAFRFDEPELINVNTELDLERAEKLS